MPPALEHCPAYNREMSPTAVACPTAMLAESILRSWLRRIDSTTMGGR